MNLNLTAAAAIALGAASVLGAPDGHATPVTVSVGLQETGVNGGAITTKTTSTTGAFVFSGTYGTFKVVDVSGAGSTTPEPPTFLDSNTIDISTSTAGTINVFVTMQYNTEPLGTQTATISMTSNELTMSGSTATLATYIDDTDGLYTNLPADLVASASFSNAVNGGVGAVGPNMVSVNLGTGLWSVTQEYTVNLAANGTANLTMDFSVPAPAIGHGLLALLGVGGVLLGSKFLEDLKKRQLRAA